MSGVVVVLGAHAHQNAAVLDAFLVVLDPFFWNVPADQGADDAPAGRAHAAACCSRCNGAGNHQADAWQNQAGANGGYRGDDSAHGAANGAADARTFGGLVAQFSFGSDGFACEMAVARGVGHDQVDVVLAVAAAAGRGVCGFCASTVREQAGHEAAGIIGRLDGGHVCSFGKDGNAGLD